MVAHDNLLIEMSHKDLCMETRLNTEGMCITHFDCNRLIFNILTKVFNVRQQNMDRLHLHMRVVTERTSSSHPLIFINRTILPLSCSCVIYFLQFVYSQARRQGGAWGEYAPPGAKKVRLMGRKRFKMMQNIVVMVRLKILVHFQQFEDINFFFRRSMPPDPLKLLQSIQPSGFGRNCPDST